MFDPTKCLIIGAMLVVAQTATTIERAHAGDLPQQIKASPCTHSPAIDGVMCDGEWNEAALFSFDLQMKSLKSSGAQASRSSELRVMNSANALYVSLRLPDATINKSINPLKLDIAGLAFATTEHAARGDDRKVVAMGLYLDKHFDVPGEDADDAKQDGQGAVAYDDGFYTFEWAVPLNSKDEHDLRAKPGDEFRFNIAFFDGFQADLKDTQGGGLFGHSLDNPKSWGTLVLAADVEDDGGVSLSGPAWTGRLFSRLNSPPASRLRAVGSRELTGFSVPVGRVEAEFSYLDIDGERKAANAKLYLPSEAQQGGKVPLIYVAGYEMDDLSAAGWVQKGYAVATNAGLDSMPLSRTINPDVALLHIVRALPFVDDQRVLILGTSAGGWAAFMLAAETFPLAGVGPDVAPMNWGYNGAYLINQKERLTPQVPALHGIQPLAELCLQVYGEDVNDLTWFRYSPLAHVSTITCPVSTFWTTADVLVPMNQIGEQWVQPFDAEEFSPGLTMEPANLVSSKEGQLSLMDVLPRDAFEVFVVPVPPGAVKRTVSESAERRKVIDLPVSLKKQWSITILDEGPPEPEVDHLKFNLNWTRDEFIKRYVTGQISVEQLTAVKLKRLMTRYLGKAWLTTPINCMDELESERADVIRGLRTYVASSPQHAQQFADLYGKLPTDAQVLPVELAAELAARDGH
ncbi:hypothetical protein V7x_43360 [Crateriforma conspicua]|uniref:Carbohydrate-binding domain-containing protein n=1 Tax=Crateriforma conspicua TaxID=2527996 RepID=A0A5C6FR51_9PLAN|nr:sugar-binding protein [Crateriforma conspicua]TWU62601.1 hypothetical protein V7x_43360 [Crateriforma conspicua]